MICCKEEWRDIPGYEGDYQVSTLGGVRNVGTDPPRQLKPWRHPAGYTCVTLCRDKKKVKHLVHRVVAETFLPNPEHKPQVNHKNGDKADNNVNNLEWCSNQENSRHSAYVLGNETTNPKRPVVCLDTLQTFPSLAEAARTINGSNQDISACCQGKRQRHKGLRWAYAEEVQSHG